MLFAPPASMFNQLLQVSDPAAPTFEETLLIAVGSLFVGYGISLWRNRVLPWATLTGFSERIQNNDVIPVPENLSATSAQIWYTQPIQNETDRLGNVHLAFRYSQAFVNMHRDSRDAVQTTIDRLRDADQDADKTAALYISARHDGIFVLLAAAISRSAIVVQAPDPALPIVIQTQFVRNVDDGCFVIDFPDERAIIGLNLDNDVILYNQLIPVVESMSRLDVNRLIPMFEALLPILQRQLDLHRMVVEIAEPLVQPRTRWSAHLSVSNYGSAPFLMFPDKGWIVIDAKKMKPFYLRTNLIHIQDTDRVQDVLGSHLIGAGSTERFMLITQDTQAEIDRGKILRALWESGDGVGRVQLHVRGRELPFALWVNAARVPFKALKED